MKDFLGNDYSVGDRVVYCPTDRYTGLVEAVVLNVIEKPGYGGRISTTVHVQPLRGAGWNGSVADRSTGRTVKLINTHRIMKVIKGDEVVTDSESTEATTPELKFVPYVPKGFEGPTVDVVDALTRAKAVLEEEAEDFADEGRWCRGNWFNNSHPEKDPEDPYCNSWKVCAEGAVLIVTMGLNNINAVRAISDSIYAEEPPWVAQEAPQYYPPLKRVLDGEQWQLYKDALEVLANAARLITGRGTHEKANYFNDFVFETRTEVLNWFTRAIETAKKASGESAS